MLKITTENNIKMVEAPSPIAPVRKLKAKEYLKQLKARKDFLKAQIGDVTAQIQELKDGGIVDEVTV